MLLTIALILLQAPPGPAAEPVSPGDAYLDSHAATLVDGARAREASDNEAIEGYRMTARQRLDVGLRAFRRDRMIFGREVAAIVDWRRDGPSRVEVLGARQAAPIATGEVSVPGGGGLMEMGFDPRRDWLNVQGRDADDSDTLVHPLAPGSEAHYRFRTGETTTLLPGDGTRVELVELQVLPRRSVSSLLSGSFWLDARSHAPVRGVFTLAAPLVVDLRVAAESLVLPLPDPSFTLEYVTVEYGLWDGEWWMPRLLAMEGRGEFGRLEVPILLEQRYEDYTIYASGDVLPDYPPPDTTRFRLRQRECAEDEEADEELDGEVDEEATEEEAEARECREHMVLIPLDTAAVLASPHLPGTLFGGQRLMTNAELEQLAGLIDMSSRRSLLFRSPAFSWEPIDLSLLRYNRVQGLTLGTTAGAAMGPLAATASLWLESGAWRPGGQLSIERSRLFGRSGLSAYYRADAFDPGDRPFGLGNSFSAAVLGRDDGDYYRTTGAALSLEQRRGTTEFLRLEVYGESQRPLEALSTYSVANLLGGTTFRPNPEADEADQLGIHLDARLRRGRDPGGVRFGLDLGIRAERGDYLFARPGIGATLGFPLPGRFAGAVEARAGTSFGDPPVQRSWSVGGVSTVRGFSAAARVRGDSYWSARAEVGTDFPAIRAIVFSDFGWAGARSDFMSYPALASAGVGVSLLDGLLRADLARATRGGSDLRLHLYLDAPL